MRKLLIALLMTFAAQAVSAEKVCKEMQKGEVKTVQGEVYAKDWRRDCSNPYIGTQIEVFNHTRYSINRIVLQANKSWGTNTNISPQTSQTFRINNSSWCQGKNAKLKLFYSYLERVKDKCVEYYSAGELHQKKQAKERDAAEALKRRKKQAEIDKFNSQITQSQNKIRDNCVISKATNAGESAIQEIRRICTEISKNPSYLQKFRWGS